MKSSLEWIDELFDDAGEDYDADRRLDYALRLLDTSTFRASGSFELDLVDCYRDFDDMDWDRIITCLKLNQLRCVDNYTWSQRELARWLRLIAFNEYR